MVCLSIIALQRYVIYCGLIPNQPVNRRGRLLILSCYGLIANNFIWKSLWRKKILIGGKSRFFFSNAWCVFVCWCHTIVCRRQTMVCSDQTMVWREQTKSSVDSLFQIKYSNVDEAASLLLISPFQLFVIRIMSIIIKGNCWNHEDCLPLPRRLFPHLYIWCNVFASFWEKNQ